MKQLEVGDRDVIAVAVKIEEPMDPKWAFGFFRLHAGEDTIGAWEDAVTLTAVLAWWKDFVARPADRWDDRFDDLNPSGIVRLIYNDDLPVPPVLGWDGQGRYHLGHLGMSSLEDYSIVCLDPPEADQMLLWRREDAGDTVHVIRLPPRGLQTIGEEFVAALEAALRAGGAEIQEPWPPLDLPNLPDPNAPGIG